MKLKLTKQQIVKILFCFFLIFLGLYLLITECSPYKIIRTYPDSSCHIESEINKSTSYNYSVVIFPKGKEIFDLQINRIRGIDDDELKIDAMLKWIFTENNTWINPQYVGGFPCSNQKPICSYSMYNNDITRLRANPGAENFVSPLKNPSGISYYTDPYWITYHKVGACTELAYIFSNMSNQVGIESHVVETNYIIDGHRWTEVKVNGDWMYVDPWCAVQYNSSHTFSLADKWRWFNKTGFFRNNCWMIPFPIYYPNDSLNLASDFDLINRYWDD